LYGAIGLKDHRNVRATMIPYGKVVRAESPNLASCDEYNRPGHGWVGDGNMRDLQSLDVGVEVDRRFIPASAGIARCDIKSVN
jgi:hypothetical protein